MTERTIRSMAKELAGVFYHEDKRTPAFRKAYPTFKHYIRGQRVGANGEILIDKPGWQYHIDLARKMLGTMLSDSRVNPIMKERIYDALVDEHARARNTRPVNVTQRQDRPN